MLAHAGRTLPGTVMDTSPPGSQTHLVDVDLDDGGGYHGDSDQYRRDSSSDSRRSARELVFAIPESLAQLRSETDTYAS